LNISDFTYDLPERLIAQQPLARRDESRLMVVSRTGGIGHRAFSDLPDLLRPDDVLVLNDTRVLPARFFCRRDTGGRIEGLFLAQCEGGIWRVMLRNAGRRRPGERLSVDGRAGQRMELVENLDRGEWRVRPLPAVEPEELLDEVGITPLPPYIRRKAETSAAQVSERGAAPAAPRQDADRGPEGAAEQVLRRAPIDDRQRYQTVYAREPGAVAAPTAGLHFTDELLRRLADGGIDIHRVTLHVGAGTFAPVQAENPADHDMHSETYELSAETAEAVAAAKSAGRRIVAVGTTSVRVLETVAREHDGQIAAARGSTKLFLYPPADFHVVDALITNFHLPKSTLLMLVAAFCDPGGTAGRQRILDAYRDAVARDYRFFSYGDAMLIE
jgi:S-adenosylmethionine:tRNA ribosyltransferase-isomerase